MTTEHHLGGLDADVDRFKRSEVRCANHDEFTYEMINWWAEYWRAAQFARQIGSCDQPSHTVSNKIHLGNRRTILIP